MTLLDASPKPFRLSTERGFLTITGRYKGVPLSIVSIGMGNANMDFFVREVRESVGGDMVVVRSFSFLLSKFSYATDDINYLLAYKDLDHAVVS